MLVQTWNKTLKRPLPISEDAPMPVAHASSAKEPFGGSATVTHTFSKNMRGFVISNDGSSDLTFTIGTDTFTVKAGEVFEEYFDPFTEVTVTTTVPFRAYGRG